MKPLLICYEGLGNLGYLKRGLVDKVVEKYGDGIEVRWGDYHTGMFDGFVTELRPILFIGHSLGGEAALLSAKIMETYGHPITCITLDPRRNNLASWIDWIPWLSIQKPFTATATATAGVKCYNFYRKGFMNGYPVDDAENEQLSAMVSHGALPAQPIVFKVVCEVLEKLLAAPKPAIEASVILPEWTTENAHESLSGTSAPDSLL